MSLTDQELYVITMSTIVVLIFAVRLFFYGYRTVRHQFEQRESFYILGYALAALHLGVGVGELSLATDVLRSFLGWLMTAFGVLNGMLSYIYSRQYLEKIWITRVG